jgi:acetyl/propionyl-CoA carboxylase alpha subunit/acetyl-CoA carboxylase carboxyltransferase component
MITRLLIANRGEIAIRIARACAELGIRSIAVFSEDDSRSLHVHRADEAKPLHSAGARAYLDIEQIVALARAARCDAVHPGYGFLAENAAFARACIAAGLIFVGPAPDTLALFGNKTRARELARSCGVPVLRGTFGPTGLEDARSVLAGLGERGSIMVKALAGGGGRGMRVVSSEADLAEAFARCRSEAEAAFGSGDLYVEELIDPARHIEVQIAGDGSGDVTHFGERECSIQRRHQKLIEIAPSPTLAPAIRGHICDAAVRMAESVRYQGLGTFEFLLYAEEPHRFAFIEANPRLQVEHTVTEEIHGVDLVQTQLRIAGGETLTMLALRQPDIGPPRGFAVQLRVNMETMQGDGTVLPSGGTITSYEPPSGPGVRVDGFGYAGYRTVASFDSLLAKLIVHSPSSRYADALSRARRAAREFRIEGVATNLRFLAALLDHPDLDPNAVTTRWLDGQASEIAEAAAGRADAFFTEAEPMVQARTGVSGPPDTVAVTAPMQSSVVSLAVREGDLVAPGTTVAVLEAMKMEHLVSAGTAGAVRLIATRPGAVLMPGEPLLFIEPREIAEIEEAEAEEVDLDAIRPDLAESIARHALTLDAARSEAIRRRRKTGGRTVRENIEDLCDPGSFTEYGALTFAAQRTRRTTEELMRTTPADGLVAGIGTVNAATFGKERASTVVVAYDYMVLAGTQGTMNHKKQDRVFRLAEKFRHPLVLFAEGGGGRPGDTDKQLTTAASLDIPTFHVFAGLSGLIPLIGIVHGRCFAGNAALLGCCDVIIATESTSLGMGGPAMIEGGGLGVFKPEEVGPVSVQAPNGVIDVLVRDEAEAVAAAKQYLAYFQGPVAEWSCPDQRVLRRSIPENRLRVYNVRAVIETLADTGSVLELRPAFGLGMITAFIRIEGRPMGLIANNPKHLAGAIDADAADKAARFLQLCDAYDIPILSLCDTPGFMVGPEAEKSAQVRRVCRMFVAGASLTVPFFTVVLRKGYGLGAQAMAGGSFHAPWFTVSWPTGEFGGMGLEGAVRLAYRNELAAIADPVERDVVYRRYVDELYQRGQALHVASMLEIDDVIDPAETRCWIIRGLHTAPPPTTRQNKKRPHIDTW